MVASGLWRQRHPQSRGALWRCPAELIVPSHRLLSYSTTPSVSHPQAIGIEVQSAREAYEQCVRHGGKGVQPPTYVNDAEGRGGVTLSEVYVYGDVVLRFISFDIPGGHGDEDGAERVMPRKAS